MVEAKAMLQQYQALFDGELGSLHEELLSLSTMQAESWFFQGDDGRWRRFSDDQAWPHCKLNQVRPPNRRGRPIPK